MLSAHATTSRTRSARCIFNDLTSNCTSVFGKRLCMSSGTGLPSPPCGLSVTIPARASNADRCGCGFGGLVLLRLLQYSENERERWRRRRTGPASMGDGKDAFAEGENALIRVASSITYRCVPVVSCASVTVPGGVEPALPLPLGSSGSGALVSASSADTGILSPAAASLVRSLTAAARELLCDAVEFEIECE